MARASYLESARAMALGTPPLAWFYAAAWPVFTPPLTLQEDPHYGPRLRAPQSYLLSTAA